MRMQIGKGIVAHETVGSALILAGGMSTRMRYDKKTLEIGDTKILESIITRLEHIFCEIILSTNDAFSDSHVITLKDEIGVGPLAGIHKGLSCCKSEYLYVTACDMPFISSDYILYMESIIRRKKTDVCLALRNDGYYEPFNAFYNKSCLPIITHALTNGKYGLNRLLDQMNLHVIEYSDAFRFNDGNMFYNINCKEDLIRAEQLGISL